MQKIYIIYINNELQSNSIYIMCNNIAQPVSALPRAPRPPLPPRRQDEIRCAPPLAHLFSSGAAAAAGGGSCRPPEGWGGGQGAVQVHGVGTHPHDTGPHTTRRGGLVSSVLG